MPDVFSKGCIIAHFSSEGNIPVANDLVTLSVLYLVLNLVRFLVVGMLVRDPESKLLWSIS